MKELFQRYIDASDWDGLKQEISKPKYFIDTEISEDTINQVLLMCWRQISDDFNTELLIENSYRETVKNWQSAMEQLDFARASFRLALFIIHSMDVTEFSKELMQNAVDVFSEVLGVENSETAQAINDLGYVLSGLGEKEKSFELYQTALDIRQRILPPLSLEIAESLSNIATHCENEDALNYLRKALEIRTDILGWDHPKTMSSLQDVAATLDMLKRTDEAEVLLIDAIKRCESIYGEYSEPVASLLDYYTIFLWHNSYYSQAPGIAERSLRIKEKIFGKESVRLHVTLDVLAHAYLYNKQFDELEAVIDRALKILGSAVTRNEGAIQKFESLRVDLEQARDEWQSDSKNSNESPPNNRRH